MNSKNLFFHGPDDITDAQLADLAELLGCPVRLAATVKTIPWAVSADAIADRHANRQTLGNIIYQYDIVAGFFPTIAIEVLPCGFSVFVPLGEPHLRWCRIGGAV